MSQEAIDEAQFDFVDGKFITHGATPKSRLLSHYNAESGELVVRSFYGRATLFDDVVTDVKLAHDIQEAIRKAERATAREANRRAGELTVFFDFEV